MQQIFDFVNVGKAEHPVRITGTSTKDETAPVLNDGTFQHDFARNGTNTGLHPEVVKVSVPKLNVELGPYRARLTLISARSG